MSQSRQLAAIMFTDIVGYPEYKHEEFMEQYKLFLKHNNNKDK